MTETTMPDTLPGIYARYRELAPMPDPSAPDVTWQLSRYLLVTALKANARAEAEVLAGGLNMDTLTAAHAGFAAVHLMEARRLGSLSGRPDVLATEVAVAMLDGGGISEWLWEHAKALGIDANEVTRLAGQEARLKAASVGPPQPAPELAPSPEARLRDEALDVARWMLRSIAFGWQRDPSVGADKALVMVKELLDGTRYEQPATGQEAYESWQAAMIAVAPQVQSTPWDALADSARAWWEAGCPAELQPAPGLAAAEAKLRETAADNIALRAELDRYRAALAQVASMAEAPGAVRSVSNIAKVARRALEAL